MCHDSCQSGYKTRNQVREIDFDMDMDMEDIDAMDYDSGNMDMEVQESNPNDSEKKKNSKQSDDKTCDKKTEVVMNKCIDVCNRNFTDQNDKDICRKICSSTFV